MPGIPLDHAPTIPRFAYATAEGINNNLLKGVAAGLIPMVEIAENVQLNREDAHDFIDEMNQVAHQIRSGLEETAALDQQTEELLMDFEATLDSMRALMAREAKRSRAQRVAAVFRTRREITKSREQLVTAWNVLHAQLLSRILSAHTSCVGLMEEIQAMMARVDGLNHDQIIDRLHAIEDQVSRNGNPQARGSCSPDGVPYLFERNINCIGFRETLYEGVAGSRQPGTVIRRYAAHLPSQSKAVTVTSYRHKHNPERQHALDLDWMLRLADLNIVRVLACSFADAKVPFFVTERATLTYEQMTQAFSALNVLKACNKARYQLEDVFGWIVLVCEKGSKLHKDIICWHDRAGVIPIFDSHGEVKLDPLLLANDREDTAPADFLKLVPRFPRNTFITKYFSTHGGDLLLRLIALAEGKPDGVDHKQTFEHKNKPSVSIHPERHTWNLLQSIRVHNDSETMLMLQHPATMNPPALCYSSAVDLGDWIRIAATDLLLADNTSGVYENRIHYSLKVNGGHPVAAHREDAEAAWKWLTEYGPQLAHEKNVSLEKIQVEFGFRVMYVADLSLDSKCSGYQAFFYQRRAYQDLYRDNIPWGFWSLEQHESNVAVNQDPCAALSIEELTHYRLCDGATGYISASTMQGAYPFRQRLAAPEARVASSVYTQKIAAGEVKADDPIPASCFSESALEWMVQYGGRGYWQRIQLIVGNDRAHSGKDQGSWETGDESETDEERVADIENGESGDSELDM